MLVNMPGVFCTRGRELVHCFSKKLQKRKAILLNHTLTQAWRCLEWTFKNSQNTSVERGFIEALCLKVDRCRWWVWKTGAGCECDRQAQVVMVKCVIQHAPSGSKWLGNARRSRIKKVMINNHIESWRQRDLWSPQRTVSSWETRILWITWPWVGKCSQHSWWLNCEGRRDLGSPRRVPDESFWSTPYSGIFRVSVTGWNNSLGMRLHH